jgi:hypothetical protein
LHFRNLKNRPAQHLPAQSANPLLIAPGMPLPIARFFRDNNWNSNQAGIPISPASKTIIRLG